MIDTPIETLHITIKSDNIYLRTHYRETPGDERFNLSTFIMIKTPQPKANGFGFEVQNQNSQPNSLMY